MRLPLFRLVDFIERRFVPSSLGALAEPMEPVAAPAGKARGGVPTESLGLGQRLLVFVYLAVGVGYLGWRAGTLNHDAMILSVLVYGAELAGFATSLLHLFMVWRLSVRKAPPPAPGLTVDILVPSYNEPVAMVRRTLLAARNVDYPHGTWLLDDGNRPEMAAMAAELGVRYLARGDNRHAKAGNLNHALRHSTADYVAIFDADHAPKRNFLDETLGFFADSAVAFVQTPQDFFNLDSYQHRQGGRGDPIWTEQSLFFRIIQRGKDVWNAAFFCGSCAVVRRSALDHIGGIATRTITEDLETSVKLHRAGYKSVYVATPLAFGIAPATVTPFLTQRIRWGQGAMQVIRQEWFFLRGKLSLAQRLNYMASALTYFEGWAKAIFYLAPVVVLLTGTMPIVASAGEFLPLFVPYFLLTLLVFEETGRGYGRSTAIEQYNMARFAAFIWATFGLVRRNLRFKVTAKDKLSPTAAEMRLVSPQILVAALNAAAIVGGAALWGAYRHLPQDGFVANLVWAGVNLVLAVLVVRFTKTRARFQRLEYRFPVPLPVRVDLGDGPAMMTVDDVSSAGCRLYGRFPATLQRGDRIGGSLMLPGAVLPFRAGVASLIAGENDGVRYTKAIGLVFDGMDQAARDQLDLFLYGSDLQWHLRALADRVRTPGQVLAGCFGRTKPGALEPGLRGGDNWSAAEIADQGEHDEPALVSRSKADGATCVVASQRRIDGLHVVALREHRRSGVTLLKLHPRRVIARLSTPTGALYLTEMRPC